MGQYQAGLLAAGLTDWCGVGNLRRFAVRFTAPVLLGDTLVRGGEVVEVTDGRARLELSAVNQAGRAVLTGSAEILLSGLALGRLAE
jgi:acyl dehydratase